MTDIKSAVALRCRVRRVFRAWGPLLALPLSACWCHQITPPPASDWTGKTDTMAQVIDVINRNDQMLPALWARTAFTASIVDPQTHDRQEVSGNGVLQFMRPNRFRLTGSKDIAGEVFQIGENDTEYWVRLRTASSGYSYWYGQRANMNRPGAQPLPIDPDLLVEVLGIGVYGTNFLEQPVPVMRFDNANGGSYVFDFNVRLMNRWVTQKEIWYSRADKSATRVILYDENGRAILTAKLGDPGPVEIPNHPATDWPRMPRHYELLFPDTGNQMTLDLSDGSTHHANSRGRGFLPTPQAFTRPAVGNDKLIRVDGVQTGPDDQSD